MRRSVMNYDTWKLASPPWFDEGPEPRECEGCEENIENDLAEDENNNLCGKCLTTLEEM
tara:strand:+ start:634 stop:810 length:177 start_codon:yes stop_codon:yes gene_type:complete